MLPLLLYKINHVTDPDCKMMVLQSIPNMVTHKVCGMVVMMRDDDDDDDLLIPTILF